jgi:hypothetical protein
MGVFDRGTIVTPWAGDCKPPGARPSEGLNPLYRRLEHGANSNASTAGAEVALGGAIELSR